MAVPRSQSPEPEGTIIPEPVTTKCRELDLRGCLSPGMRLDTAASLIEDARLALLGAAKLLDGKVPNEVHKDVLFKMDGCRNLQARLSEFKESGS